VSIWDQPSPSDVERASQRVIQGEPISDACKAEGFTLSRLRQCDRAAWAELRELAHDVQRVEDRHTARDTLRQIATSATVDAKDRNRAAELLGKSSGYLTDRVEVAGELEVSNPDVSQSIDRFTAAVVQQAARAAAGTDAADPGRLDEGEPRLRVAPLDRPS
jgi:hypothetical protein